MLNFKYSVKKKTKDLLNFKYSVSPIGYVDLLPIWNCTEETIYLREACGKFLENVNDYWLICQRKIEYVIKN
uniref:Ribosomal protein S15 n=1 Tax=Greenwayodendron suaveolens TaxID=235734 RepID=A0A482FGP5_9MAGN|nr:ribosomal protein S15 [Greenwayodendron suaveolens]QBO27030.1 ribosomal protein S15 [Greenwayodendron suaveolens]